MFHNITRIFSSSHRAPRWATMVLFALASVVTGVGPAQAMVMEPPVGGSVHAAPASSPAADGHTWLVWLVIVAALLVVLAGVAFAADLRRRHGRRVRLGDRVLQSRAADGGLRSARGA